MNHFSGPFLDFERPVAELQKKIEDLRSLAGDNGAVDIQEEIDRLQAKGIELTRQIFSNLTAWQIVQIARHAQRPHTSHYIPLIFDRIQKLSGDRHHGDDASIIAGLAMMNGRPLMLIGQEKGRSIQEKLKANFGMPQPEGYRKARRLMQMAETFNLPIITLIDTPGAYPGISAEQHNQSEAIAGNLKLMSRLKVPVIALVIGEGGSGGALAIGVADRVLMMQYSVYSVISPEGCASILWKDAKHAPEAAESMHMTSAQLLKLKLIDAIIEEPLGGAHRDIQTAASSIKAALIDHLDALFDIPAHQRQKIKIEKLMQFYQDPYEKD